MNFHLSLDAWPAQASGAREVRTTVFLVEQKIPVELEWDEFDATSLHALAHDASGNVIATGRLLPDGHIGRMAVLAAERGKGVGGAILSALMRAAQERGHKYVVLNAQIQVGAFYERFGFAREGEIFLDAGIPHILMRHVFA